MKNKKAQKSIIGIVIIIFLMVLVVGGLFLFLEGESKEFIEIEGLYDSDGNLIQTGTQSVIGDIEGVKYITLSINVENLDIVDLNLNLKDMTPNEILSTKPTNTLTIEAGEEGTWITGLIDVEPYEETIQEFCVTVESEKIPSLRESSEISGCVSIKVDPNPSGSFDISLDSNVGDGNINPSCIEDWNCGDWSDCSNSLQTRNCVDLNDCETTENKPEESKVCVVVDDRKVIFRSEGSYGSGKEIALDYDGDGLLDSLEYWGEDTSICQGEFSSAHDIMDVTTPEGYLITKYSISGSYYNRIQICNGITDIYQLGGNADTSTTPKDNCQGTEVCETS